MYNLDKKICLVTGGTGLIGSSIVKNLSSSGATVIFTFNGNKKKSNKLLTGRIYKNKTKTFNPAFDVTPSKFITALITENGICKADFSSIKRNLKI